MLASGSWRDVDDLTRLAQENAVPDAPGYHEPLARKELQDPLGSGLLEDHVDPS